MYSWLFVHEWMCLGLHCIVIGWTWKKLVSRKPEKSQMVSAKKNLVSYELIWLWEIFQVKVVRKSQKNINWSKVSKSFFMWFHTWTKEFITFVHLLNTVPKKVLNNGQKWTNCIGAINFRAEQWVIIFMIFINTCFFVL